MKVYRKKKSNYVFVAFRVLLINTVVIIHVDVLVITYLIIQNWD